ncbi:MAG: LLM class flavin-dependent oxidoreductase [bacterium]|nr:LLM class flavin-dependent oxidoreductase [bacterium]MCP4964769.1 LLM class flavin-dependent oxidoreductase [bacterium]
MADDKDSVRYGLVLPNWEAGAEVAKLVDAAVAAEEAGWDGVFLADHLIFPPPADLGASSSVSNHWDMPDPWITLSAIASRTRRIRLGTWVTPVARRQPWQLARDLATLDRLSEGRVMLGVGLGRRPDYEQFGLPWSMKWAATRCDEALVVVAGLWSGESVSFVGDHFQLDNVVLLPTPVQRPRIPIVIGGLWPRKPAVRRGAVWDGIMTHFPGDGVLPSDDTSPEQHASEMVSFYRSMAGDRGDVFLPMAPDGASVEWLDLCRDLDATWLYTAKLDGEWTLDLDRISQGPQAQLR